MSLSSILREMAVSLGLLHTKLESLWHIRKGLPDPAQCVMGMEGLEESRK